MSTLTLPNGTVLTQVTRQSCLDRLFAIPLGTIPYSNSVISPITDRRSDCTGLVSAVWDTPKQGRGIWLHAYSTATFYSEKVIERIDWADLKPGDTVGYYIPDPDDSGPRHGAIWLDGDRFPSGRFHIRDHGSGDGPKDRWVQWNGTSTGWLHPDHLAPWRYVAITEGADMPLTPAEIKAIADEVWNRDVLEGPDVRPAWKVLGETYRKVQALETGTGTVTGPVDLTPAAVAEIRDAVADLGEGGASQVRTDAP